MARRGGGKVVKEGYLTKSPPQEKALAQWHKRYFVLWSTKLMEYYSSYLKKPQDYLKTIDLENCEDMVAPFEFQNKPYVIKLSIKTGEKLRDYLFQCESEADLNGWVDKFASVCGFTPVDEEEEQYEDPNAYPFHSEERPPPPLPPLDSRRPLPSLLSPDQMRTRPPLPVPPPGRPEERSEASSIIDIAEPYEDPRLSAAFPSTYESIGSEDCPEDVQQEQYEDLNINEYMMRKNPPPIWKGDKMTPPPVPKGRTPPRRWTKSLERGISPDFSSQAMISSKEIQKRPLPQIPPPAETSLIGKSKDHSAPSFPPSRNQQPASNSVSNFHQNKPPRRSYETDQPPKSQPPPPPSKPKPAAAVNSPPVSRRPMGGGPPLGFNVKNDPKFGKKLQEKRDGLYNTNENVKQQQQQHRMQGNQTPCADETYDEIDFVGDESSLTVPLAMKENQEGYIDVVRPESNYSLQFDPEDSPPPILPKTRTLAMEIDQDCKRNKLPLPQRNSKRPSSPTRDSYPFTKSTSNDPPTQRNNGKRPVRQRSMSPEMWTSAKREDPLSPTSPTPPPLPSREIITAAPVISETNLPHHPWDRPPPPVPSVTDYSTENGDEPPPPPLRRRNLDKSRSVNNSSSSLRSPSPDNILPVPPRMHTPIDDSGSLLSLLSSPLTSPTPPHLDDGPPVPSRSRRTPEPPEIVEDMPPTPPARSVSHDGLAPASQKDFSRCVSTPAHHQPPPPPATQPKPKTRRARPSPPSTKPPVCVEEASWSEVLGNENEDIFEEVEFGKPAIPQANMIKELNRDLVKKQHSGGVSNNQSPPNTTIKPPQVNSRVGMPSPPQARKPQMPKKPPVATRSPQVNPSFTPPAPRPHRVTPKMESSKSVDLPKPPLPPSAKPKPRPSLPASKPIPPPVTSRRPPVLPKPVPSEPFLDSMYSVATDVAPPSRPQVRPKPRPTVPPKNRGL